MQSLLLGIRPLIPILLLIWTSNLFAQAYHPFPDQGTWYFKRYGDMGQPVPGYDVLTTLGDTVLAGHACKKVLFNGGYYGALRDSSKRIYYRAEDETQESILYDFNKVTGDTIIAPYPMEGIGYSCDTLLVTGEDQFPTLDGARRQLNLIGCMGVGWIEGIGNTWWLTSPAYLGSVSGATELICFFDSTQLVYALESSACALGTSSDLDLLPDFAAFPNPTTGLVTFPVVPDYPYNISIIEVHGQIVKHSINPGSTVDISGLLDGIYWLRVQTGKQAKVLRIVKVPEH